MQWMLKWADYVMDAEMGCFPLHAEMGCLNLFVLNFGLIFFGPLNIHAAK
jgi:hypothetical protein